MTTRKAPLNTPAGKAPAKDEPPAQKATWRTRALSLALGLGLTLLLALVVAELDAGLERWFKAQVIGKNPLEYPLLAVLLGLLVNGLLHLTHTYDTVRSGLKMELFLKVGLVLMGARISAKMLSKGLGGLIQAVIMTTSVFFFTWWLGGRLKLDQKFKAVMAAAVSICGVSAAIAAAGAVLAKKEDITYITALVIVVALPMMALMPWLATALGLSPEVAGAWFGGNIDTTAAVVGARALHSEVAQQVAGVVKMAQNAFIGVAAFLLAFYFVVADKSSAAERPSPAIIWQRFPKFVLGFVLTSLLASSGALSKEAIAALGTLSKWAFTLAFVTIGLDLSFKDLGRMGWPPVLVYLGATVFNTLLALGVASVIFGVLGM